MDGAARRHSFGLRSRFGRERCFAVGGGFGSWYYCCDEAFYGPGGNSACWSGEFTFEACCNDHTDSATRELLARVPEPCSIAREGCSTLDDLSRRVCDGAAEGGCRDSQDLDYYRWYAGLLAPLRDAALVLEMGVRYGTGLAVWAAYFPRGLAVGVDVDLAPYWFNAATLRRRGLLRGNNCIALQADQTSPALLDSLAKVERERARGPLRFDLMVDDALHQSWAIVRAFEMLFPTHFLAPGGYYVVEDLFGSGYRYGGPDRQRRAVQYFSNLSSALLLGQRLPAALDGLVAEVTFLRHRVAVRRTGP